MGEPEFDDADDEPWYDDTPACYHCHGEGEVMWCPDDICRGGGECIHGDGMMTCPRCGGSGDEPEPPSDYGPSPGEREGGEQ